MKQCKHEWYVTMTDGAWCKQPECNETMTMAEVESELNTVTQLETEQKWLQELGTRTRSLLERSPGPNCDTRFFAVWTKAKLDLQEKWKKALGGDREQSGVAANDSPEK